MKKIVVFILFFLLFVINSATSKCNITGRWAEKISERVVMEIQQNNNEYQIFITWREDNLAQKDIYRFIAKSDKNGNLKYKNGIHIYRYYDNKNNYEDKIDYTDGSGRIQFNNDKLVWLDNKDKTETEFIRANEDIQKIELNDKYNSKKDYFDYSVVLTEFPKDYYYTTVKINKSKKRILIITDKVDANKNSNNGLFYYFAKNGFVYPLGYLESTGPIFQSNDYLYLTDENGYIKFYMSDKNMGIIKSNTNKINKGTGNIKFETIKSADKFAGDFGEAAGDDVVRANVDGFYFEYHKPQYKKKYIKSLMKECINDGVKTQVQMYCCIVKKLHP